MIVNICPDYQEMSRQAFAFLIEKLQFFLSQKDRAVVVPSAGSTPRLLYRLLAENSTGQVDWKRVIIIQMDEYQSLPTGDAGSMAHDILSHLIEPLNISEFLLFLDESGALSRPLQELDAMIKELGGIDIFVHGIGENGHLGFNEPGSAFDSQTRIVELSESTRRANSRFFAGFDEVPQYGITLGLKTIWKARTNIVLASGPKKREAVNRLILEPKNVDLPASILKDHPDSHLFLDAEAAGEELVKRFGVMENEKLAGGNG